MQKYHNVRFALLVIALLFSLSTISITRAQTQDEAFAANQIVVKLLRSADLSAVATQYALALPALDQFGSRPIYRLRITDGRNPRSKAEQVAADARVEFAEPNYIAQAPEARRGRVRWAIGGDAESFATQWIPQTLRLAEAHAVSRGAGVTVAILDTGIDPAHPAFAGRLVPGYDFVDLDNDPREVGTFPADAGYGHGTHVAGLVALVAPDARIMPIRVLDREGAGNIWVLAEGLRFALNPDGNPRTNDGATVINLSLGTLRRTRLLDRIIAEASCDDDDDDDDDNDRCLATGGAIVIAAAGNGGDSVPQYPAAEGARGSVAVAASTRRDTLASFSTRGPWVKLSAPGEQVISTVPGGAYGTWSGTSMAAPSAAGVAALLRAREPALSAVAVANRLVSTAQPICTPAPPRLDAAAVLSLAPRPKNCPGVSIFLPITRRSEKDPVQ